MSGGRTVCCHSIWCTPVPTGHLTLCWGQNLTAYSPLMMKCGSSLNCLHLSARGLGSVCFAILGGLVAHTLELVTAWYVVSVRCLVSGIRKYSPELCGTGQQSPTLGDI